MKYEVFPFDYLGGRRYWFVRLAAEGLLPPYIMDHTCFMFEEMALDYCALLNYGAKLRQEAAAPEPAKKPMGREFI